MRSSLLYVLSVVVIVTATLLSFQSLSYPEAPAYKMQPGDIIFQTSLSSQSKAIQLATNSPYSHMGILFEKEGKLYVFEAVQPGKYTPLQTWVERGEGGKYVVKRLKNADKVLTVAVTKEMKALGNQYLGKDYDSYFEWSDDRIYCSELVWKLYNQAAGIEIGQKEKLGSFDLSSKAVQNKLKERFGNDIPKDETVISPAAMFNSPLLETVVKH